MGAKRVSSCLIVGFVIRTVFSRFGSAWGAGIGFPGIYPVNGPVLILFPTEMGFSGIFFPHKRFLVKVEPFLCLIFLSH
jgi:hypothetical protein